MSKEREQFIEDWIAANGEQYERMYLTPRLWAAWVYEQLTKPEPPMGHTFTVVHEARRLKAEGEDPKV